MTNPPPLPTDKPLDPVVAELLAYFGQLVYPQRPYVAAEPLARLMAVPAVAALIHEKLSPNVRCRLDRDDAELTADMVEAALGLLSSLLWDKGAKRPSKDVVELPSADDDLNEASDILASWLMTIGAIYVSERRASDASAPAKPNQPRQSNEP